MNTYIFSHALRWAARIIGAFVVLLIVAFAIGEGVPNPLQQSIAVNLSFLALLVMLAGIVVAWKREEIGGALIIAGFGCFAAINRGVLMNAVFLPMLLTGLLFLLCSYAEKMVKRNALR